MSNAYEKLRHSKRCLINFRLNEKKKLFLEILKQSKAHISSKPFLMAQVATKTTADVGVDINFKKKFGEA